MDVTAREIDAVALVDGVVAELLPAAPGRLVVTPHPFVTDGQTNVPADLLPGESLAAFLDRHVPGIASGAWVVSIGGCTVPPALWDRTYPKHGHLIACRCVVQRDMLRLVAMAALTYFTIGAGSAIWGINAAAALGSTGLAAAQWGTFFLGSMLINKVLAPKVPDAVAAAAPKQLFSLSGQRNTPRPYEFIPTLLGVMRVTPDLAAQPYTWYQGDDQYLGLQLLGGINVHAISDVSVGETPIGNYTDVTLFHNGFSGMESVPVPLHGNVDSIPGAALTWEHAAPRKGDGGVGGGFNPVPGGAPVGEEGPWVARTSSAGAVGLQVDVEGRLYDSDPGSSSGLGPNTTVIRLEYRAVGAANWTPWRVESITNNTADTLRYTWQIDVPLGQYEVRARVAGPTWGDPGDVCEFSWVQLKTLQPDTTDYSGWGRLGIRIKASGQISGGLDTVRFNAHPRPLPVWTPGGWINATTLEQGACNPGALVLQVLRGIRAPDGKLQFGLGLSDDQIDIEGLKAFMLHCAARAYTYSKWVTSAMSVGAILEEIALAGMGQFMWIDGSRPTVQWVASGQPDGGVVNMANIRKGTFSVSYALAQAADGIEYSYLDRNTWEMTTLRVSAPGVVSPTQPARVTGEGVTSAAHAAVMARYHLAQSLYQYKTISFGADIEHLDYRRLAVLSISHDMTQWGFGGRLVAADVVRGKVVLTLDEPVPALPTPFVGVRVPGERTYRTFRVEAFAGDRDTLTLVGAWPDGVALPGAAEDNPAHDTLWCYDFKETPGLRARVVSITPQQDLAGADVVAVPESDEFWNYVYNGTYVPAPGNSSLPQLARPKARNLRVAEQVNVQGDTEWYELRLSWDIEGAADHCQVWAALDGQQLRLVDAQAQGNRSVVRIDAAGEWLIEVRPFDASGRLGEMTYLVYGTAAVDLPPRNVDTFAVQQVAGELRRFIWAYANGQRPANLAGVQIRYRAGAAAVSVADWDALTPILGAGDVYSAELETTRPDAGRWTFAVRAINTAGRLANGVRTYTITLQAPLASITDGLDDLTRGLDDTLGLITGGQPVAQMPKLPAPLAPLAAQHTTILAAQGASLSDAAAQLLQSVLAYGDLQQRMSDAGIVVDPATGTVRIYGVEANAEKVSALQILIDGIKGQLQLKATTQYVDAKIAQAVLGVADLALFEGMDARIHVVEVDLDSIKGEIKLLASSASVQGLAGRVGTAEQRLDAQAGQILARVTTAQFEAAQGTVNGRLATAEQQLEALGDAASIRQSIVVASQNSKAIAGVGEILLRNLLADWKADNRQRAEAASATSDLRVRMDEGLLAEATRREELGAAMRSADAVTAALVAKEETARVQAQEAQARQIVTISAAVNANKASADSSINTLTTAQSAQAGQLSSLASTVGSNKAAADSSIQTLSNAQSAQAGQLSSLASTVGSNKAAADSSIQTLSSAQSAQAGQLSSLASTVGANKASADSSIQTLTSELAAQAGRTTSLASTVGANKASADSSIQTLSSAQSAQAGQLSSLASTVGENRARADSQVQALASEQSAQTSQLSGLSATVGGHSASISQQGQALAWLDGRVSATWSLSVVAGKYVAGMAINNDGTASEMVFLTDKFAFARQVNDQPRYLLTGGQVNGVDTVGIRGDLILDRTLRAQAIFADELTALGTSKLGYVNAGRIDIASDGAGGWGYVRSANKWLGDGSSGFIFARSNWGDVFAEIQAGAMRLSMHRDGGYMRLEGPWGRLDNNGMEINQLNVIGAAQIRGEEITRIRALPAPYRQNSSEERIDLGGYDPGGAWVLAGITCSVRTPDQGGDSTNSLRPEFFFWEIWRDGVQLATGGPDIGFTEVVLPADSGAKTYTLFVRGTYIMRAVFSLKAFRR